MEKEEAIRSFEENNNLKIADYHSDRRICWVSQKRHDQYIGNDIFEDNIQRWLNNFTDKEPVLQLLANYTYVPELKYGIYLDELLKDIVNRCGEGENILSDTYFITFPSSKGVKSGGDVIRSILPLGYLDSIGKNQLIADAGKNLHNIKKAKCLVFIDDIIGSGETAKRNIFYILNKIKNRNNKKIFLAVMFAEKGARDRLEEAFKEKGYNIEILVGKYCMKCMSEGYIFSKEEISKKEAVIQAYEERIEGKKVNGEKSCAMGFRNSQLLLSFFYNTPNNTLCMFWKPTKNNTPPFLRTSFQRPDVGILKKIRKNRERNAYEMAKLSRSNE